MPTAPKKSSPKKKKPVKKVAKACKCLEQVQQKLAQEGIRLATGMGLNFETGECTVIGPYLETEKIDIKSRKKKPTVLCTYCPFCGKKM